MVWFVGAGPGAPDLITVRGLEKLRSADVVVYAGSLVNPDLLAHRKESCEVYNSASMTLEEVVEIMIPAARAGKEVVRLHTGDPSLYGAIREQIDLLDSAGIAYEVVPGVSSFAAAAAVLDAEFTLPGISQSLIITRMAGRTPVPEREAIAGMATHGSSMAIFLSTGLLEGLSTELVAGGCKPGSPAAIVYKASWPEQKVVRTTVAELAQAAAEHGIQNTALILVGEFLGGGGERSKLYDPGFSHQFREGTQ